MEDNYPKAYKETYEIVNNLPQNEFEKIPKEVINMLKMYMDKDYDYNLDKSKSFEDQTMLKETKEILAIFYKDYWATPKHKERIEKKIKHDLENAEKTKLEKYNPDNMFKNKNEIEIQVNEEVTSQDLVQYKKDKWYLKLFGFIKRNFKK